MTVSSTSLIFPQLQRVPLAPEFSGSESSIGVGRVGSSCSLPLGDGVLALSDRERFSTSTSETSSSLSLISVEERRRNGVGIVSVSVTEGTLSADFGTAGLDRVASYVIPLA